MRTFILINFLFISSQVFAGGYVSLEKAKDWLSKNKDKCVFAAARTYRGKTSQDQSVLAMIGAKSNDVERFSSPNRTPSLCIFDGTSGKGAAATSGCMLAYYMLDQDNYESVKYSRNDRPAAAMLPGKCTAESVKKFLLNYKFDDFVAIGPYLADSDVWINYSAGFRGDLEADIHVLADEFGVKPELDAALKKDQDKANAEKAKKLEEEQKKKANEAAANTAKAEKIKIQKDAEKIKQDKAAMEKKKKQKQFEDLYE